MNAIENLISQLREDQNQLQEHANRLEKRIAALELKLEQLSSFAKELQTELLDVILDMRRK